MARKVLTIETGLRCNNHCLFCPQRALRGNANPNVELTTAEVVERILAAKAKGFEEIAFTGGEPAIRPDFDYLIATARSAGFKWVSVSTNGRIFAYLERARRLLQAGLTGVSVSLHAPTPNLHDTLSGTPGAFEQALLGIQNLKRAAEQTGLPLFLNTVTLLLPDNAKYLRETLIVAGSLGISLHIVQPFIASREVIAISDRFLMTLDAIVASIEQALKTPLPHGGRIKPYNIPPCRLAHLGDAIEAQSYALHTAREYAATESAQSAPRPFQFIKIPECASCKYICPGIRLEHWSESELLSALLDSVDAVSRASTRSKTITLACLDLLDRHTLDRFLSLATKKGQIRLLWGGFGRLSTEELLAICRRHNVLEVCFVLVAERLRPSDRRAILPGNISKISQDLALFTKTPEPKPTLLVPVVDIFDKDCCFGIDRFYNLIAHFQAVGGDTVRFVAADSVTPCDPPFPKTFLTHVATMATEVAQRLREKGVSVSFLPPIRRSHRQPGFLESLLAQRLPQEHWDTSLALHPLVVQDTGWVMWSRPSWILPPE